MLVCLKSKFKLENRLQGIALVDNSKSKSN